MANIFRGVTNFISALAKGADNILFNLFGLGTPEFRMFEELETRFPDLPRLAQQQTLDFTELSIQAGGVVNTLPKDNRIAVTSLPLNPAIPAGPTYWVDVEWSDPVSGNVGKRLVILTARPGETKEQFESRAKEESEDVWDKYPEFDERGNRINPEFGRVVWLRGYQGTNQ